MSKNAAVLTEDKVNTGRMASIPKRNNRSHTELSRTKERRDKDEGEEGGEKVGPACTWG